MHVHMTGLDAAVKDGVLRRWTADRLQVVTATIAFGMGINKVRVTALL